MLSAIAESVRTRPANRWMQHASAVTPVCTSQIRQCWRFVAAAVAFAITSAANADEGIDTHGAHEHGIAMLNVAVEAKRVELEFESPSINVIGFEHAPRTEREYAAVTGTETKLRDARQLFILTPAAECRLLSADVDSPAWKDRSGHADYEARYVFECNKPQLLRSIDVRLVADLLLGDTKLRVQVAGAHAQTTTELTRAKSVITIP